MLQNGVTICFSGISRNYGLFETLWNILQMICSLKDILDIVKPFSAIRLRFMYEHMVMYVYYVGKR